MTTIEGKIIPNLWFDRESEDAARLYASLFERAKVGNIVRAGRAGFEIHGLPEGTVMSVDFEIEGQPLVAINGGPLFKFTPAVSFLVACRTKEEVDALWAGLSAGGSVLMELGAYPFSERYGWTTDRFGLSWQVMAARRPEARRKIVPTLMFVGEQCGKAQAAISLYTSIFEGSEVGEIQRHGPNEEHDREGTILHASFKLAGQDFAAMDSGFPHGFSFNESVSFMVPCRTQDEIDDYWAKLLSDGGQESMCGWLKDRFGVSWQVTPLSLHEMLGDPDPKKVERVTKAYLRMKKFDIVELRRAFEG